jgi:site-specific recombinase XerD
VRTLVEWYRDGHDVQARLPRLSIVLGHQNPVARQRQASPRTVASYRDTLRLLLSFVERETGKAPSALDIEDLNARVISAFLDHLETERHNTPRTRNARLGAIRSLFRYAALRHPEHAELIAQVLAIPRSASPGPACRSSPQPSSRRCSPPLTWQHGRADETGR